MDGALPRVEAVGVVVVLTSLHFAGLGGVLARWHGLRRTGPEKRAGNLRLAEREKKTNPCHLFGPDLRYLSRPVMIIALEAICFGPVSPDMARAEG